MLGLGNTLSKIGLVTPGIVTSNLVLKHKYDAGDVVPVSDGAAYFDGTDDYIAITEVTDDVDGANFSYIFWAKRNATDAIHCFLGHDASGSKHIRFTASGTIAFESNSAADIATGTLATNDTNWHHYAIIVSGGNGTVSMYQDGVSISVANPDLGDNFTYTYIGKQDGNFFNGYVCNAGIWSAVLTQAQIKSIMWKNYAGLTSSETTNLVSWWNLSADANDSHGSNNGTLS